MKAPRRKLSLEEVLDAYTVEKNVGRETLERYLEAYAEYAVELVDFSRERSRFSVQINEPLGREDTALIDKAWKRYLAATSRPAVDVFAAFSVDELRDIANRLGVPRQILAAFREGRVIVESVPRRFLSGLANALKTEVELLTQAATQSSLIFARSHKADVKPASDSRVTFDQLLIEAGVPEEKRGVLLKEDD